MNNNRIETLKAALQPVRERLIGHPVYAHIQTASALRVFMQHHVYAVWDFMSLLKALQKELTCVDIPWIPKGNAATRYLINEIVLGEESDVDERGIRTSHFELYLRAMRQAGADTGPVESLLETIRQGVAPAKTIAGIEEPGIHDFLDFTFETIRTGGSHGIAAVFAFGREDLIPDMFLQIVRDLSTAEPGHFDIFKYYLERHIEVDGDHHSHLAMDMVETLCGQDDAKWADATRLAIRAMETRILLWDGVLNEVNQIA